MAFDRIAVKEPLRPVPGVRVILPLGGQDRQPFSSGHDGFDCRCELTGPDNPGPDSTKKRTPAKHT